MSKEAEQTRTPGEDKQREQMRFLTLAPFFPVIIIGYFAAGCASDVAQQVKHSYYHALGIPHRFNTNATNFFHSRYERLDKPHDSNLQADEKFIMHIGRSPKHAFSE